MSFGDGIEKAGSYASQAFELMKTHDVPAAPPNFEVWYSYVSERFPDLKKTLDQMIDGDGSFDGMKNADLYETFIGHMDEKALVQETGGEIQNQVKEMLMALGGASDKIKGFSASIATNLETFSDDQSLGGIEQFVQNMMLETRRIQKSNELLQSQLNQSSEKISALQNNLEKAEQESYIDALTGIANRKKFDVTLRAEMQAAAKSGEPLCLALGDIDLFKKFNDSFGHQVGDQVLKLVAMSLHDNVKGSDLAARYGGEEFALILPNTKLQDAYGLVESIRETIGSRRVRNRQKGIDYGAVTLSLGLAEYKAGEAGADLVGRADAALYDAKDAGRNQTIMAD
ncbi:MAG: GGDEF domain-containing protein [Kordiimonadales bacterium]|nr:MAG: GGDEF domain-containing protein [Kordiimonadales bacterium]